jgi:hypothetical protein
MKIHTDLTLERWFKFSLFEQLANIGCDVDRAIRARQEHDTEFSTQSLDRALELLDATIQDPKHQGPRLKELLMIQEALIDDFRGENKYQSTDESWQQYFYAFNYAAALQRGR